MSGYELLSVIGEGATAISYRARTESGDEVLVKRFKTALQYQKESVFSREVEVLCGLEHPQIPRYIDHYIEKIDGRSLPHIVQEFIHGEVLKERIERQPPTHGEILDWLEQILRILSYLHDHVPPIIHRDIKPENLIITEPGVLVLIDFGLAVDDQERSMGHSIAVGTLGYQAPEQISGNPTILSDLYSVGAMGIELWTKKKPVHMLQGMRLRWEEHCLGLPIPVQRWLDRMLANDPKKRFSHALEALEGLCHGDIQDLLKRDVEVPAAFLQQLKEKQRERQLQLNQRDLQWNRMEAFYQKDIQNKRKEYQFELQRMLQKEKQLIIEMEKAWILGLHEIQAGTIDIETLLQMMLESFGAQAEIEDGELRIFVRHALFLLTTQIDHVSCNAYRSWCHQQVERMWIETQSDQDYQEQLVLYTKEVQLTEQMLMQFGFWRRIFQGWRYKRERNRKMAERQRLHSQQRNAKQSFVSQQLQIFWAPIAKQFPQCAQGLFTIPTQISGVERRRWAEKETEKRILRWEQAGHMMPKSHYMVFVPAGTFIMGKKHVRNQRTQNPAREVTLKSSFWMASYLCTQELYIAIMSKNPSAHRRGPQYPVDTVSWFDALRFCNRLSVCEGLTPVYQLPPNTTFSSPESVRWNRDADGYRLPTSAEWEYASRGGEYLRYAGSNDPDDVAWFRSNSHKHSHPVGEKKPNSWGLFDMTGNVWEWVFDGYDKRNRLTRPGIDPVELKGKERLHRGGGFLSPLSKLELIYCDRDHANFRSDDIGFRVVRSL